jgi:hypothetical protein
MLCMIRRSLPQRQSESQHRARHPHFTSESADQRVKIHGGAKIGASCRITLDPACTAAARFQIREATDTPTLVESQVRGMSRRTIRSRSARGTIP